MNKFRNVHRQCRPRISDFRFSGVFCVPSECDRPDPWRFGFAVVHKGDHVMMGMCGFVGPPNSGGVVEIGYGIAPAYQNKGYATEAAQALLDFAARDNRVKMIRAYTLAEANPSTRVLEKCGFRKTCETRDPENNLAVWRWEQPARPGSTS